MRSFLLVILGIFLLQGAVVNDPVADALEACNEYRLKKGRDSLELDSFLCKLAFEHSKNMAKRKVGFGHSGFKNRSRMVMDSLQVSRVAENVFYSNTYADPNGQEAIQGWIDSREHRKNMLQKDFKRVGFGYAQDKRGRTYFTQILSQ